MGKDIKPEEVKKEEEVTSTPVPAAVQQDPEVTKVLKELQEAIAQTREINKRVEEKEKELDERLAAPLSPPLDAKETELLSKRHLGKMQRMKENLVNQPKIQIYIPMEGKELPGQLLPVTLNGYRVNVPKGVYVLVPKQVGDAIMESLNQTEAATHIPQRLDLQTEDRQRSLT